MVIFIWKPNNEGELCSYLGGEHSRQSEEQVQRACGGRAPGLFRQQQRGHCNRSKPDYVGSLVILGVGSYFE